MDKNETYRKIIEGCRAMADLLEEELKGSIETAPKAEAEKKAEKKTVALEDVRAALSAKSSAGLSSQVRMLLGLHSAKKLSEVKKEEYELLLAQAHLVLPLGVGTPSLVNVLAIVDWLLPSINIL